MNKIKSASYEDRLQRVSAYIYENLDQDIDLARLADIACMSPFHWHRVYRAVHGETITSTVKRLRLNRAAADLMNTNMPVNDIAIRAGYNNLQSFTRLFKDAYGLPPAKYRQKGAHILYEKKFCAETSHCHDIKIEAIAKKMVACLPHTGSYLNIGNAFDRLFGTLGSRTFDWSALQTIGIFPDDPESKPEETLQSKAGVVVDGKFQIPPSVQLHEIRSGTYAILRHKGPYATMKKTYHWLFGEWLVNSSEEADDAPVFEMYLNNPRETPPGELLTDIYLPLIS